MGIPRSSFYYKAKEKPPDDPALVSRIEGIVEEFNGYGYRRVRKQLNREGLTVNEKKIRRIMDERDISCRRKKRFVATTDSDHAYGVYPNLLADVVVTGVNQAWVSDITYIPLPIGFAYLATVLDLYSRKVIGYAVSGNIDANLTLRALYMAIQRRRPPKKVIHHSDRGKQYAASEYVKVLDFYGFQISMSRKGNPYDNATAESFFKTLKAEEVYLWEYRSIGEVEKRLSFFIEEVYNKRRLHSSIGYMPPDEFEEINNQNPGLVTLT